MTEESDLWKKAEQRAEWDYDIENLIDDLKQGKLDTHEAIATLLYITKRNNSALWEEIVEAGNKLEESLLRELRNHRHLEDGKVVTPL